MVLSVFRDNCEQQVDEEMAFSGLQVFTPSVVVVSTASWRTWTSFLEDEDHLETEVLLSTEVLLMDSLTHQVEVVF